LVHARAGLRHDADDRAVGEPVLWRVTDLVDRREELRVLRRPLLARGGVVRRLHDRVVAGVGLPLALHGRGHRVLHEFPRGLLLGRRTALHDVERSSTDDVAAVLRLAVRTWVEAGAELPLTGDGRDVTAETRGALDVHRGLLRVEGVGGAVVVDARVEEVAAIHAGLPPVEDRLALRVVVDDLRRAVVAAVAVVRVERA